MLHFSATRFRWSQKADGGQGASYQWGVREIYVGRACSEHCNGHGSCRFPSCLCDSGYSGPECGYQRHDNPVGLKGQVQEKRKSYAIKQ